MRGVAPARARARAVLSAVLLAAGCGSGGAAVNGVARPSAPASGPSARSGEAAAPPDVAVRAPVLAFPQPGLDDPGAYGEYSTRLFRDARGNTIQVYVDGDGRVVHLWADAANESLSFSARDAGGAPLPPAWGDSVGYAGEDEGSRVFTHVLRFDASEVRVGHFLLGSMREERDFQYQRGDQRALDGPPFVLPELTALVDALAALPPAERAAHLRLLAARDTAELRARLRHEVTLVRVAPENVWTVRVRRPSLDGRSRLVLELRGDGRSTRPAVDGGVLVVRSLDGSPVRLTVSVRTDAAALHPLDRRELFTDDFLSWAERGGDVRLERGLRGAELLASREKLMAGLPNFATYFGRDMMMSALMMAPVWRAGTTEHVLASVLRKVDQTGDVSHEEALGGQAIRENAADYGALLEERRARAQDGDAAAADSLLGAARERLRRIGEVRENHHMLDDDFQLPVLAARYLDDERIDDGRKRAFLLEDAGGGEPRVAPLVRNLALVARRTAPYAASADVADLVSFRRRGDGGWSSASWRDSGAGYAGGRYAMDVNAIWAPAALRSTRAIVDALERLGWSTDGIVALARAGDPRADDDASAADGEPLADWLRRPDRLDHAIATWRDARRHFRVTLPPAELRARVDARLDALPPAERAHWRATLARSDAFERELTFAALALDSAGVPIPVLNTDPATRLLLEDLTGAILRGELAVDDALRFVEPVVRPFPVGLLIEGVGPVVANDAFAGPEVWRAFEEDRYRSPRTVWGREVNLLLLGLARQLDATYDEDGVLRDPVLAPWVRALRDAIGRVSGAAEASGLRHIELWSYEVGPDGVRPVRFGFSSDVQLWNVTELAVRYVLERVR